MSPTFCFKCLAKRSMSSPAGTSKTVGNYQGHVHILIGKFFLAKGEDSAI